MGQYELVGAGEILDWFIHYVYLYLNSIQYNIPTLSRSTSYAVKFGLWSNWQGTELLIRMILVRVQIAQQAIYWHLEFLINDINYLRNLAINL